jgi:hypothetical protein
MKKHINGVTDPVESPIVRALSNLYAECSYVVIYVMYAPAGQGKTFGARTFLKNFYEFDENEYLKGLMIGGDGIADENYMDSMGLALGADRELDGWIHAVLLAMDEPDEHQPSILILDDFNSLGREDVNKSFVKRLYQALAGEKHVCCAHGVGQGCCVSNLYFQ